MNRYLEFILNHYILSLALATVTFLLIQELIESAGRKFQFLSPTMTVAKMNTHPNTAVIDVRDYTDFNKGHIESATNIPLDKLKDQVQSLAIVKDQPIIVACQNAARATSACKILTTEGFNQVFCLTGGMDAWTESKLPIKITRKKKS